ncbi:hypothetical protein C4F50_09625 [Flavobacterium sp. KB82]|uniref:Uncharacterized protein n=1 Tax=Flavobacterium hungaricum TaxID=2082725 RepID=A0ABR9TIM5_9FLAO|nr:hypothetical protein [Flavobacterium hungaricum]
MGRIFCNFLFHADSKRFKQILQIFFNLNFKNVSLEDLADFADFFNYLINLLNLPDLREVFKKK